MEVKLLLILFFSISCRGFIYQENITVTIQAKVYTDYYWSTPILPAPGFLAYHVNSLDGSTLDCVALDQDNYNHFLAGHGYTDLADYSFVQVSLAHLDRSLINTTFYLVVINDNVVEAASVYLNITYFNNNTIPPSPIPSAPSPPLPPAPRTINTSNPVVIATIATLALTIIIIGAGIVIYIINRRNKSRRDQYEVFPISDTD